MDDPITTRRLRHAGRARVGTWVVGGVLAISVSAMLAVAAQWWEQDRLESDLADRARTTLEESGFTPEGVAIDGRDATLYGTLASEPEALHAVRTVDGIRMVKAGESGSGYRASSSYQDGTNSGVSSALARRALDASALRARVNHLQNVGKIVFEPDTTEVSEQGRHTVVEIAKLLREAPNARVEIAGHAAGSTGVSDTNTAVAAQQRANAVFDLLVEQGVPPEQLQAKGYSDTQPKDTLEDSRRVEIIVH
ncbi:MAG: OmpA family protein [Pseudonocardiaceae bacterium]|nr:OmpA family protein [Pseudonocardiaceae bacterium]